MIPPQPCGPSAFVPRICQHFYHPPFVYDLSVQYVLENSLRENENHLRLTAQLIQVKDQTHLWSKDYDYSAKDVLNVEDELAKAVAREIQLRLTSQQQAELSQSHPVNPEAFDAYLQGYYYFERNTDKDT